MLKNILVFLLCLLIASVVSAGEATINLTWDPNSEPDLAGYRVYESLTAGGPYSILKDVGNVTTFTIKKTVPDGTATTLYYVVTAYDQSGLESDYSNEVNTDKLLDFKFPDAPANVQVQVQITIQLISGQK